MSLRYAMGIVAGREFNVVGNDGSKLCNQAVLPDASGCGFLLRVDLLPSSTNSLLAAEYLTIVTKSNNLLLESIMVNKYVVSSALGIWGLSCIPTATAALIWNVCNTDAAGVTSCQSKLSPSAKVSIAIACAFVLLLLLSLVICIISSRRAAAAASEREYNVEASQVHGPPTIIATEYDPTSGPSGIYGSPRSDFTGGQTSAQMTGPAYPAAAQVYSQHRTAPATQSTFPGYSPHMGSTPRTAFVFPRPLLAGDRLKEKLKERPASVSHIL